MVLLNSLRVCGCHNPTGPQSGHREKRITSKQSTNCRLPSAEIQCSVARGSSLMHSYGSKSVGTNKHYFSTLTLRTSGASSYPGITHNRSTTRNSLPTLNLPGGASSLFIHNIVGQAQTIFIITFAILDEALLSVRQFDQIAPSSSETETRLKSVFQRSQRSIPQNIPKLNSNTFSTRLPGYLPIDNHFTTDLRVLTNFFTKLTNDSKKFPVTTSSRLLSHTCDAGMQRSTHNLPPR